LAIVKAMIGWIELGVSYINAGRGWGTPDLFCIHHF
jgi:hypothetical protein